MSLLTLPSRVRRPPLQLPAAGRSAPDSAAHGWCSCPPICVAALLEVEGRDRATLDDLEWADAVAARIVRREAERQPAFRRPARRRRPPRGADPRRRAGRSSAPDPRRRRPPDRAGRRAGGSSARSHRRRSRGPDRCPATIRASAGPESTRSSCGARRVVKRRPGEAGVEAGQLIEPVSRFDLLQLAAQRDRRVEGFAHLRAARQHGIAVLVGA